MGVLSVTVPRVSNTLRSNLVLANLTQTAAELAVLQNRISSGRRVMSPSDSPYDATVASQLQNFIEQKARFQANIENATGVISSADAALGSASDLINRAREIGLEEIGTTATEQTRRSSAAIIDQILSEMVNLGNLNFAGRYVFGGRNTLAAPFSSAANGIYFGGDRTMVEVSIDYSATSSTTVDAASAFGAISAEVRGRADINPAMTNETLLTNLNGGQGVKPGAISIFDGFSTTTVDLSGCVTVGDVVAAINAGAPAGTTSAISAGGDGLTLTTAAPGGTLSVDNVMGGSTATDLGIYSPTPAGATLVGSDADPRLVALTPLSAVAGVDWASGVVITNGGTTKTIDFSSGQTIEDVLNAVNNAGLHVEAKINDAGTGIDIVSRLSGTDFTIGENGGTTATDLGIRSFDISTTLASLNGRRGVATVAGDDVTITLKDGTSFGVDIDGCVTIADVIGAINSAPGNPGTLSAGLAAVGNGIALTDSTGGAGDLTVTRANYSEAAGDLGILGTTSGVTLTGSDVNRATPDGAFTDLIGLKEALLDNDNQAISYYTGKLETDLGRLLERRASLGAKQQRMETVNDRISSEIIELRSLLSERIDLDYAESIVRFSTLQASYEAGLQTAGSLLQMSLIDFLR
jgi:flagellar hook-associated protein 3 FlgL